MTEKNVQTREPASTSKTQIDIELIDKRNSDDTKLSLKYWNFEIPAGLPKDK